MQKLLWIFLLNFVYLSVGAQLNMSLRSQVNYTPKTNDIWGWVDPDDGTEYAIVGLRNGVSIVSLEDPDNATEVVSIPGQNSIWRDIKTWGNYAYVVTDQNGTTEGVTVIDLSDLPNSAPYFHWTPDLPDLGELKTCHNIYIDEFGYAYLSGCNMNSGGMLFIDVFSDPGNPSFVGPAPSTYAHDVYVRDNKMYAAEIYEGRMAIYDVADKDNPSFLGSTDTPLEFTHNVWLSEDGNIAFTTDERANAPVASYDVSDPSNIIALDEFRPLLTLGLEVIPHNVHVWGEDWLVISYYTDGGIIADASRPDNIIEVGNFDTFLGGDGGYDGAWGLYPYLPSGLVLVSDIDNGLYVLDATYVHACWLEGKVTDANTGLPLFDVDVQIISDELNNAKTDLLGSYKSGVAIPGTFDVTFTKFGYYPKTIQVTLENGVLEILDVELASYVAYNVSGLTVTNEEGTPIPGVFIEVNGESTELDIVSDQNGQFEFEVFQGSYNLTIGAWGYKHAVINNLFVESDNSITITLEEGYQDDFFMDFGWVATKDEGTETGFWEKGVPQGTYYSNGSALSNTDADVDGDIGNECYVTGNGGGDVGDFDVDGGAVYLTSPLMDLSDYIDPVLSYRLWWFNDGGNATPNDNVSVYVSNGTEEVLIEMVTNSVSQWRPAAEFHLSEFITLTDEMYIQFVTADDEAGNLVEAAVDAFSITETGTINSTNNIKAEVALAIAPNPFQESVSVQFELNESFENGYFQVFNTLGQQVELFEITTGSQKVTFGEQFEAGVYFLRLIVNEEIVARRKVVKS
jgi:choice-of-anchor B domain-containing protein